MMMQDNKEQRLVMFSSNAVHHVCYAEFNWHRPQQQMHALEPRHVGVVKAKRHLGLKFPTLC